MKIKPIILVILILTSGIFYYNLTDGTSELETHYVSRVVDGDTVELDDIQKVRFLGINAPESSMSFSEDATEFLEDLVEDKMVEVESHGTDKYGRLLAYIFIDDKNVNEEILSKGLGTLYYYDKDNHYEELKKAEEFARSKELGIWGKSSNEKCVKLIELKTDEPEKLVLENVCDFDLDIMFKDDATHIYRETLLANSKLTKTFSHIWNTDGDSIYIRDSKGLLLFYRYN